MHRHEVINTLLRLFESPSYLEVGVNRGETFFNVNASMKVAVDPKFLFDVAAATQNDPNCAFHEVPSDRYFSEIIDHNLRFDVIYLDGLHTFEQTLRDFTNAIQFLKPRGVIVIDDVKPTSYQASLPDQLDAFLLKKYHSSHDNSWMGDTYKLVFFIETFFPTWQFRTLMENHGQAVVWRATKVRSDLPARTVREVANMQFIDFVKQSAALRLATMPQVVQDLTETSRFDHT